MQELGRGEDAHCCTCSAGVQAFETGEGNRNQRNSAVWTTGQLGSTVNQFMPQTDTLCSQKQNILLGKPLIRMAIPS